MQGLRITDEQLRELVVDRLDLLDPEEFERARRVATRLKIPLERAVVERGRIPLGFLLQQIAHAWGVRFIDLKVSDVRPDALRVLPEEYARRHGLVPLTLERDQLRVAMCDPRDTHIVDEIERMTKLRVVPLLATDASIARAQLLYRGDLRTMLERAADEHVAPTIAADGNDGASTLLNRILEYAAIARASDIHIEPYELETLVRCRVDGVLHEILSLSPAMHNGLAARIKVLAQLRIDERRLPQDGRFEADLGGFPMDLRVSTLPTHWGEKIVLRVLAKETLLPDLEDLGLVAGDYETVVRNALKPHGMILVTGPTGSGKSTTLYALLARIGAERQNVVNISTVEDPVEYTLPRINQLTVNPSIGLDFPTGLRALVRQDPDVMMVGEIRDRETVEIAVRAALVGRLLLSTLHTNDATSTITRLLDMGVEPYLVASTLTLVIAQRLVRRICAACRESVPVDAGILDAVRRRPDFDQMVAVLRRDGVLSADADPFAGIRVFRGTGCAQCGGRGFRGRIGIFEVFEPDDEARRMIMERHEAGRLREAAIARGMKTMFQDGLAKVFLGETTIEEVLRVAM